MWVVLECDCYSLEDTFGMYTVGNVYGPFVDEAAAAAFAKTKGDPFAIEFQIRKLEGVSE